MEWLKPHCQVRGGEVRTTQIKPGFLAVEGAVADEDQPQLTEPVISLPGARLIQEVVVVSLSCGGEADRDVTAIGLVAGFFPKIRLVREIGGVFSVAGSTCDENEGGAVRGGSEGGTAEENENTGREI